MQAIGCASEIENNVQHFRSFIDAHLLEISQNGWAFTVNSHDCSTHSHWRLTGENHLVQLESSTHVEASHEGRHSLAVIDAVFACNPGIGHVHFSGSPHHVEHLLHTGVAVPQGDNGAVVAREAFWQSPRIWHSTNPAPYPTRYVNAQGTRHPLRRPKTSGVLYQRHVPWLNKTLSFRTLDPKDDLPLFHKWMNDPRVAQFWQEEGDLEQHKTYIQTLQGMPHQQSVVGCFDDIPFGYFETYWAKEDRIAPFCNPGDHDRGWHALVGEPTYRGRAYLSAWMPSLAHYLFLDDCRTERVVVEPRVDNQKMIGNLSKCGYALLKEFSFPHKRAALCVLSRERFFEESLWIPKAN